MTMTINERVLIFKGRPSIVDEMSEKPRADRLYAALKDAFEAHGFKVELIDSPEEPAVNRHGAKDVAYLIGHSRGASKIIRELDPKIFPNLRGIICLDPNQDTLERWKGLKVNKLLICSTIRNKHSYAAFSDKAMIEDDHYFNASLAEVEKLIARFLKTH